MANRFWVGGTGNWSDNTNHWSATSGGAGGASVPTSADNVYFDANSFTSTGQTVTIAATAYCRDMDWTGAVNNPTLGGASQLYIYGSLKLILGMTVSKTGGLLFTATSLGNNITTVGKLTAITTVYFNSASGEWTLQDDLNIPSARIDFRVGTLNTNDKNISCESFALTNSSVSGTLNLGASVVTISNIWQGKASAATLNAGTSKIILTGNTKTFHGKGLTYYDIEFQGTPTTITDSNTFHDLKVLAGKTVKFTAGTTQAITSMSGNGISGSLVTLQSTTAGSTYTLSKSSGILEVSYYSISDSIATGGASFYAPNSTNGGNNTGWTFTAKPFPRSQAVIVV